jgi:hypothetical protein
MATTRREFKEIAGWRDRGLCPDLMTLSSDRQTGTHFVPRSHHDGEDSAPAASD